MQNIASGFYLYIYISTYIFCVDQRGRGAQVKELACCTQRQRRTHFPLCPHQTVCVVCGGKRDQNTKRQSYKTDLKIHAHTKQNTLPPHLLAILLTTQHIVHMDTSLNTQRVVLVQLKKHHKAGLLIQKRTSSAEVG